MDTRHLIVTFCPCLWRLLPLALLLVLRPLRVLRLVLPRPLRLVLPRPLRLLGAGRGARPSHRDSDMATVTLTPLLLRTGGFTLTLPEPGTDCCMVAAILPSPNTGYAPGVTCHEASTTPTPIHHTG